MLFAAAFLLGIFSGTLIDSSRLWWIFAIPLFAALPFSAWRMAGIIISIGLLLGLTRIELEPRAPDKTDIGSYAETHEQARQATVIGRITRFPDYRFDKEKWVIEARGIILEDDDAQLIHGRVLIVQRNGTGLNYGDIVTITGKLEIPFESEEFSYKNYLAREHVYAIMNYPQITLSGENEAHFLISPLFALRQWFDRSLKRMLPGTESAYAAGILIGDRSGFSPAYEEAFRKTGLSHLLALSGFNITIIVLAVFWVLQWFPKPIRLSATITFLVFFVFFVGGGASIIRAAVMGIIGLFVVHSGRISSGLTLLLLASVLMAFVSPLILTYDPSFQLSFAGVVGLLGFATPLKNFFGRYIDSVFWRELLAATLAAQLGVMPLLLSLFGEISLIAPLANLMVAPMVPIAMLLAFLTVIPGSFLSIFGGLIAFFTWNLLHINLVIIKLLAAIPGASIAWQVDSIGAVVVGAIIWLPVIVFWLFTHKCRLPSCPHE